jgi:NTE family protein
MKGRFDHTILLMQGGGALGAYQAGAYEGLVEAGLAPDWVVGISIGAVNAALIVGNPPGGESNDSANFGSACPLTLR